MNVHGSYRPTVAAPLHTEVSTGARSGNGDARKYLRGSSLLLGGRFISILLNLAVQVVTVRYLSKGDYGAFAYALGIASMGSTVLLMGLGKAVPRFVPIYHERGDYARAFGAIALAAGTIWGLGVSLVVLTFGLRDVISGSLISDPQALSLLLILIALCPISAFDTLLQKVVAVFASARAIFFRRHVLGPGLKLAIVLLVVLLAGDVQVLAYGYLVGGLVGVSLYITILIRVWRKQGMLEHMHPRKLKLPARELFGFSLPLLSSDLPVLLRGAGAIILLEFFHSTVAVAEYRAVLPVAGLNMVVFESFAFLFVPVASRMFARDDAEGINDLYWNTSLWITVLTFPVFAVTCSLAAPVTILLFGAEYANAGTLLSVLALGFYFNAALGFNAKTLRVYGKVRHIVIIDLIAAAAFVALGLLLIPAYGALGAALATMASMILHNIFNHLGLWLGGTGVRLLEWRFVSVYLIASFLMLVLLLVQRLAAPPVPVGFALAALMSLILIRMTRRMVNVEVTFPELLRIPILRRLIT
jgi:O-antigen/teichoic acid export membrane protein